MSLSEKGNESVFCDECGGVVGLGEVVYKSKDVKEAVEKTKEDNELSVIDLKERLKKYPDDEFLIGRIQGIRTAEDHMEKRFGEFK